MVRVAPCGQWMPLSVIMPVNAWLKGVVRHRRHQLASGSSSNARYAMSYRVFMAYGVIDELRQQYPDRGLKLMRFRDQDYWPSKAQETTQHAPLETRLRLFIERELGISLNGKIVMLGHLRQWGLCFNPVCFYFCYDAQGTLKAIAAEITNTPWGERHCYVFNAQDIALGHGLYEVCFDKRFHVSPFMPMALRYRWRFNLKPAGVHIFMALQKDHQTCFDASLSLKSESLSHRVLPPYLRFPLMVHRVLFHIYLHAARLWLKGVRFYPHPKKSRQTVGS